MVVTDVAVTSAAKRTSSTNFGSGFPLPAFDDPEGKRMTCSTGKRDAREIKGRHALKTWMDNANDR